MNFMQMFTLVMSIMVREMEFYMGYGNSSYNTEKMNPKRKHKQTT